MTSVTKLTDLGPALAKVLQQHGFETIADLAAGDGTALAAVPGIGAARCHKVQRAAQAFLAALADDPSPEVAAALAEAERKVLEAETARSLAEEKAAKAKAKAKKAARKTANLVLEFAAAKVKAKAKAKKAKAKAKRAIAKERAKAKLSGEPKAMDQSLKQPKT